MQRYGRLYPEFLSLPGITIHPGAATAESGEYEHHQGCGCVWFVTPLFMSSNELLTQYPRCYPCPNSRAMMPSNSFPPHTTESRFAAAHANPVLTGHRYRQRRLIPSSFRRPHCRCNRSFLPTSLSRIRSKSDCGVGRRARKVGWRPLG